MRRSAGERSPLRYGEEQVPYVFMSDPQRAYKKRVRQLQCYLCTAILGVFTLALLVTVAFVGEDVEDVAVERPGALALSAGQPLPSPREIPVPSDAGGSGSSPSPKKGLLPWPTHSPCIENEETIFDCPVAGFRSTDGFCNNLNHPLSWGLGNRPFRRLLPSDYCDGASSPKCSSLKSSLPSSYTVSSKLHGLLKDKNRVNNMLGVLWSHFIYQDLVEIVPSEEKGSCCNGAESSANCYPIQIPLDDPKYPEFNATCIPYTRAKSVTCADGKRQPLNKATSFLDGSVIYGSSDGVQKKLRKYEGGQLVLYITPENKYLPIAVNEEKECNISKNGVFKPFTNQMFSCISQQMNLSSINLILAKHHNSIASQLSFINPQWTDEELFQNTKKIVIAQIQHITFHEYLQTVLGAEQAKSLGTNEASGYYSTYDDKVDSTVSEGFANAFKLLSTLLPGSGNSMGDNGASEAHTLYTLAHHIQSERDQGVPGYVTWYHYCGLGTVSSFDDLEQGALLQATYQDVKDVDLFAGLVAEMPVLGGSLGPVGSCILTEQLKRTKTGDRFWFETFASPQMFNAEQLAEIHKSTLSRIICDNSKSLKMVQYNIMKDTEDNPTILCDSIPAVNLSLWEEKVVSDNILTFKKMSGTNASPNVEKFMDSGNEYMLKHMLGKASAKSDVTKKATNFMMNVLNATIKVGDEIIYDKASARPPFTIPLDSIADTSAYNPAANVKFMANYEDDILQGTLTFPIKNTFEGEFVRIKRMVSLNFTAGVTIKWSGTFDLNPKKTYDCKLMFQSYAKLFSSATPQNTKSTGSLNLKAGESGEQCNIFLVGTFYHRPFYCPVTPWWCQEGMIFYWSGDTKLIFTYPASTPNEVSVKPVKKAPVLGKAGNDVVEKTFASVTVVKGKITGQYNVGEAFEVMNGSPPININLDNFVNPNSFDVSVVSTFQAKALDESTIQGTFSVPYFPTLGDDSGRKKFTANFTVDIIYKYGGAIEIIDPAKTYTCKTMFHSPKKSILNSKLMQSSIQSPVLGKTPYGESCSITISGSFVEKAVYCFFTPWLCSDEKSFLWSGDIELALKYRYNKTDETPLKQLGQKKVGDNTKVKTDVMPSGTWDMSNSHRFGGRVSSGWVQIKTGGLFSSTKTIWSGEIPFQVKLPIFWSPTNDDGAEISDVYGHAVLWSASIFHSTLQGSFSFPQYIGNGPASGIKWISGKFSFQIEPNPYVSLYDLVVPSVQYKSNLYFRNSPDITPFANAARIGEPSQDEVGAGIRAPIILLGKYTADKNFIWNGTFVVAFTRTARDLYYG